MSSASDEDRENEARASSGLPPLGSAAEEDVASLPGGEHVAWCGCARCVGGSWAAAEVVAAAEEAKRQAAEAEAELKTICQQCTGFSYWSSAMKHAGKRPLCIGKKESYGVRIAPEFRDDMEKRKKREFGLFAYVVVSPLLALHVRCDVVVGTTLRST